MIFIGNETRNPLKGSKGGSTLGFLSQQLFISHNTKIGASPPYPVGTVLKVMPRLRRTVCSSPAS